MIAVSVVLVLAAIALPKVSEYQQKAKLSELAVNYDGLWNAVYAYRETTGADLGGQAPWNPGNHGTVGKNALPWVTGDARWGAIAWKPDGAVRCGYSFTLQTVSGALAIMTHAMCNVDADGYSLWAWNYDDWGAIGTDNHF